MSQPNIPATLEFYDYFASEFSDEARLAGA
jgi:hypothetical protein